MVLVKVVGEMLDGDYLKHLLVHHHLGNIQRLPINLYEYFLLFYSHKLQLLFSSLIMSFSWVTYLVTSSFTLCNSPSFAFCIYFSTTTT